MLGRRNLERRKEGSSKVRAEEEVRGLEEEGKANSEEDVGREGRSGTLGIEGVGKE